jgi:hypothetical protein
MKVLKSEKFSIHKQLVEFVIKNNILREDILIITQGYTGCTLYYY